MFNPEVWFWIWAVMAALFFLGELFTASFFLLPFGVGAVVAAVLAYLDVGTGWQWLVFIVVSGVSVGLLRQYADKFTHEPPMKTGADRLVGKTGIVIEALTPHSAVGQVRIEREEWRADAPDCGPIAIGETVVVKKVVGTHLVVCPAEDKD